VQCPRFVTASKLNNIVILHVIATQIAKNKCIGPWTEGHVRCCPW